MKPIDDYNFREICEKTVKMEIPEALKTLLDNSEYMVAVGYIDSEHGISFQVVGVINEDKVSAFTKRKLTLRYDSSYVLEPFGLEQLSPDMTVTVSSIISSARNSVSHMAITFRCMDILDPYRDNKYPDDIILPSYSDPPKLDAHSIWMKPDRIEDEMIIAKAIEKRDTISVGDEMCILPKDDGYIAMSYNLYKAMEERGVI